MQRQKHAKPKGLGRDPLGEIADLIAEALPPADETPAEPAAPATRAPAPVPAAAEPIPDPAAPEPAPAPKPAPIGAAAPACAYLTSPEGEAGAPYRCTAGPRALPVRDAHRLEYCESADPRRCAAYPGQAPCVPPAITPPRPQGGLLSRLFRRR